MGCRRKKYDRRKSDCQTCPDAEGCKTERLGCYGAFRKSDANCQACRFASFCNGAADQRERQDHHGAPSVTYVESLEDLPPEILIAPEGESRDNLESAVMRKLFEDCGHNPRTIAIVIARHCGMAYKRIAKAFGMSKQLLIYHVKAIEKRNPVLYEYLTERKVSKHFHSAIREEIEADNVMSQMDLFGGKK